MRQRRGFGRLLGALALAGGLACDEGTPVSPEGSVLRVSASPGRITSVGSSTITVEAVRKNGLPVASGTRIRLATTLGEVDEAIETDGEGIARGTLRGDGQSGTATVTATSGAAAPVSVEVAVGTVAATVQLQVSPASVPASGGSLTPLALVRDDRGQPLAEATVSFATEVGTLASGGGVILSNSLGEARDQLAVTAAELSSVADDAFEVSTRVGGPAGVESASFAVVVQRAPKAAFTFARTDRRVAFTDTSTGGPTEWEWAFGDGEAATQQNPVHDYAAAGSFIVVLVARNAVGEGTANDTVVVP